MNEVKRSPIGIILYFMFVGVYAFYTALVNYQLHSGTMSDINFQLA